MSLRPDWQFDSALGERKLLEHLGAASLQAWGAHELGEAHAAAAGLLAYAEHTQGRQLTHIHTVQVQRGDDLLQQQEQHLNQLGINAIRAQQEHVKQLRLNARFELARIYDKLTETE